MPSNTQRDLDRIEAAADGMLISSQTAIVRLAHYAREVASKNELAEVATAAAEVEQIVSSPSFSLQPSMSRLFEAIHRAKAADIAA